MEYYLVTIAGCMMGVGFHRRLAWVMWGCAGIASLVALGLCAWQVEWQRGLITFSNLTTLINSFLWFGLELFVYASFLWVPTCLGGIVGFWLRNGAIRRPKRS